jgi:hypothetical protein
MDLNVSIEPEVSIKSSSLLKKKEWKYKTACHTEITLVSKHEHFVEKKMPLLASVLIQLSKKTSCYLTCGSKLI